MDASSRAALAVSRERLAETTRGAAGPGLLALADELFAVARLLEGQISLRRALSDASAKPGDRAGLVRSILGGKVSAATVDLVETVARQRWSRPLDLVEAVETLAVEASLTPRRPAVSWRASRTSCSGSAGSSAATRSSPGSSPTTVRPWRARRRSWTGWSPAGSARSPSCCCGTP
jgi:hypothetical protein